MASIGSEMVAELSERCFYSLRAPGLRVSGYHVPYPPTRLEEDYRPTVDRILDAVDRVMGFESSAKDLVTTEHREGLVEAEIVTWKVNVGDQVTLNQPLVDIETAKATVELPSPYAGTVVKLHGNVGDVMEVHKPLITFEVGGSAPSAATAEASEPEAEAAPESHGEGRQAVLVGYGVVVDMFFAGAGDAVILDAREPAIVRRRQMRLDVIEIEVEADVAVEIAVARDRPDSLHACSRPAGKNRSRARRPRRRWGCRWGQRCCSAGAEWRAAGRGYPG